MRARVRSFPEDPSWKKHSRRSQPGRKVPQLENSSERQSQGPQNRYFPKGQSWGQKERAGQGLRKEGAK